MGLNQYLYKGEEMIPQGYKQTEIGVIPEDWDCVAAKHLMKIETGSRNTEHKTDIGKYPFFVRSQKVERIDTYHYDCEAVLTAGDGVGTGKVFHHYIGKFDAHQRVYVMSNFDGITGRYFYNYFSENFGNEVSKYTAKSSVDSVRRDMIAEMLIPLPSLPEQESIAEALSDVDSMISSLEKLIEKKKAVKQGAMQELLTGKKRLPGFAGDIEHKPLSSLCTVFADGDWIESKDQSNDGIRLIQTGNIGSGKYLDKADKQRFISEDTFNRLKCLEIFENDVLVSRLPDPAGRACILPNSSKRRITAVDCTIIRFINYNPILFVAYSQTKEYQDKVDMAMAGSTRQRISRKELGDILIPVFPSKEEQNAIASILSDMDYEIEALEQKLDKTRQIKQGMMQQLLTGKIRLV